MRLQLARDEGHPDGMKSGSNFQDLELEYNTQLG